MRTHLGSKLGAAVVAVGFVLAAVTSQASRAQDDTIRGLIVYARFAEDTLDLGGVTRAHAEWADPTEPPLFANQILSRSPQSPFVDSTLTAYYYAQSLGRFTVYGDAYPEVVELAAESHYLIRGSTRLSRRRITSDIREVLLADPLIRLEDYDANYDGHMDHLFVVVHRAINALCESGAAVSDLGWASATTAYGNDGGVIMDNGSFYQYNSPGVIIPNKDLVRLMAHELGHAGWNWQFDHLKVTLLDMPSNGPQNIGYSLMVGGTSTSDARGDLTISPGERILRGWITCETLVSKRTVVLRDLYSRGDCVTISVPASRTRPHDLYIVNRQRIGYFDRLTRNGFEGSDHGLMTVGLLVQAVQGEAMSNIPADGELTISSYIEDYQGDLFGPDTHSQLTPWTRPNINGWMEYPSGRVLDSDGFQALDNIRYSGAGGSEMALEYVADFRWSPTFREDSWIGAETAGQVFVGSSSVVSDATLTISTDIDFRDTLIVASGSTLVIEPGGGVTVSGHLKVERGAAVVVRGFLEAEGTVDYSPLSISCPDGAVLRGLTASDVESHGLPETVAISVYPNPLSSSTRIESTIESNIVVRIYDMTGREVTRLWGFQTVEWRPDPQLSNGTYLLRIETGRTASTRLVILLRQGLAAVSQHWAKRQSRKPILQGTYGFFGGPDETRTRDLLRDRQAF